MNALRVHDTVLLVVGGSVAAAAWMTRDYWKTPIDAQIEAAARESDVPSNLLRAIARVESGFKSVVSAPNANGTRDYGIFQINEKTAAAYGYGKTDPLDPAVGARIAARLLAELRKTIPATQAKRPEADRVPFSDFAWVMGYNVGPDLEPAAAGRLYADRVSREWQLYTVGGLFR